MADYFEPGFAQIVQAVQEIQSTPFSRLVHTAYLRKRHVERLTAGWRIIDMQLPPGVQWRKHGRSFGAQGLF